MPDALTTTFLAIACTVGPVDAVLLLRDLPATLRARRLHRRTRRWVRVLPRPVLPAPTPRGRPRFPRTAASVAGRTAVTLTVTTREETSRES